MYYKELWNITPEENITDWITEHLEDDYSDNNCSKEYIAKLK